MADRILQYRVTAAAPPYVLRQRVNEGDIMNLTEKQARTSVALGYLVLVPQVPPKPKPPIDPVGVAQWKDLSTDRAMTIADLGIGLRSTTPGNRVLTLPRDLPEGFWNPGKQWADGKVSFLAASGASITNLDNGVRTRGKGSSWFAQVVRNVDGESAEWDVTGDFEEAP